MADRWHERNAGPMVAALIVCAVIALIVAALVQESHDVNVTEGRVTKKEYIPAHTEHWTTEGHCISRDEHGWCTWRAPDEHHSRFVPDYWRIWITADVDNDGDLDTDWHEVSGSVYNLLNEGDWYRLGYGRVPR